MPALQGSRTISGAVTPTTNDDGWSLRVTANATVTLTNSGWTVGRSGMFFPVTGAATVTFTNGAGVTVRNVAGDLVLGRQYDGATALYTGTNEWTIYGSEDPQIPAGYVTGAMMQDATIGPAKLGTFAVTSPKLADLAVTTGKLADGAVTLAKQANVTGPTALGRVSGTGPPQPLTPAQIREAAQVAGPVFDVRHYGAVGDGVADDTAAIQAAIDAAVGASGGVVWFPPGTYLVTDSFDPITIRGVWLRGFGMHDTIIRLGATLAGSLFTFETATADEHTSRFCGMLDMTIWGDDRTFSAPSAIYCEAVDTFLFENLFFQSVDARCFHLVETWDSRFYNCHFHNSGGAAKPSVEIAASTNVKPTSNNNDFYSCFWAESNFQMLALRDTTVRNRFFACKFHGKQPTPAAITDVLLEGAQENAFIACSFPFGGSVQVSIQPGATNTGRRNRFIGCLVEGFREDETGIVVNTSENAFIGNMLGWGVNTSGTSVSFQAGVTNTVFEGNTTLGPIVDNTAGLAFTSSVRGLQALVQDLKVPGTPPLAGEADPNTGLLWSGSDVLSFVNNGTVFWQMTQTGTLRNLSMSAVTNDLMAGRIAADSNNRFSVRTDGMLRWGSGSAGQDVNLYRGGADVLRTDDKLNVVGELEIDGALNHDGSTVGFMGATPVSRPTVTGSRGGNAALASLLTALANLGLITDSSTA